MGLSDGDVSRKWIADQLKQQDKDILALGGEQDDEFFDRVLQKIDDGEAKSLVPSVSMILKQMRFTGKLKSPDFRQKFLNWLTVTEPEE
jgi:hypothetical protein